MKCINKLRERAVKKQAMGQFNTGNELRAVIKKQAMNQFNILEKMLAVAQKNIELQERSLRVSEHYAQEQRLSMRDHFAAHIISSAWSADTKPIYHTKSEAIEKMAKKAYEIADMMLFVRK